MLNGKILLLAGAAALLPAVAGQVSAQPTDTAGQAFAPPDSPMVLTRTVWRTLVDGKQLVIRRRYAVRFSRRDDGFVLDGRLLEAAVEAPPMLSGLAELERNRGDEGLFPLLIDNEGRIRASAPAQAGSPGLRDNARVKAQNLLAAKPQPLERQREAGAFLAQLSAQGASATWPADLFNPASGERLERRRITLPDGQEGEVKVAIRVTEAPSRGLPRSVERTVTTVLAGTSRTSRELWTLAPTDQSSN
jgi:hypothetical protein